eukprot:6243827-Heterocapsa_arctica.AAC.1
MLEQLGGLPDSIDDWPLVQDIVWRNRPTLPEGWLCCWSKTHDREYFYRRERGHATFELAEVPGME